MKLYPGRLYHSTPGWVKAGAIFHVRIRAAAGQIPCLTDAGLAPDILHAVRRYHELGHWWCELCLLMPDHMHVLATFPEPGMAVTIRDWKRGVARFQGVRWQDNFFDHRIRSEKEYTETGWYIRRNPVVKELCAAEEEWPWYWTGGGAA